MAFHLLGGNLVCVVGAYGDDTSWERLTLAMSKTPTGSEIRGLIVSPRRLGETLEYRMHILFIAFVSFVAYATGVVTVRRWRAKGPVGAVRPLEALLAFAAVASSVFLRRPYYSARYVALCALGMWFVGGVVGSAMLLRKKHAAAGTREYEEERGAPGDVSLWKRWLNASRAVVDYEFRLMLLACYLLVIGPFALVFRLRRGKTTGAELGTTWVPRGPASGIETARRPF
jgi:hypothetical protein